jgi:hypothetical protein
MYVAGESRNRTDPVLNRIDDPAVRASLIVPLRDAGSEAGLAGTFDIVLATDGRFGSRERFPPRA